MDTSKTGKAIAYLRKLKGLTQKQLADILGISDKAVSKWERGISCPDVSFMNQLAVILDSDVGSLLEGKVGHRVSRWKGLLYLNGIDVDMAIGEESLLSIQLCYFVLAGINEIAVVCEDTEQVEKIVCQFPNLCIQAYSNDDLCRNELKQFIGESDVMIVFKPIFLYGVNITQKFRWAMEKPSGITALVVYDPKEAKDSIFYDSDQRLSGIADGVTELKEYSYLPILFCRSGEFWKQRINWSEIAVKYIEPVRRGTIKIELDDKDNIKDVEVFMDMMKRQMGIDIYNLKKMIK